MASATAIQAIQQPVPPMKRPWEIIDQEIAPFLSPEMVFGELRFKRPFGQHWQSSCPIHDGNEPDSFWVDPEKLQWICFNGCGGGGPIQFLQVTQGLDWMEAGQALAVLAGIDPMRLQEWARFWTQEDFALHDRIEHRAGLLRLFMAIARSALLSSSGTSLREYLENHFSIPPKKLETLGLGLYTAAVDVFPHLKRTGHDLSELKSAGLFDSKWQGRIVAPWDSAAGRTVNLWSWDQPIQGFGSGDLLFTRDTLGSQRAPFQLSQGLKLGKRDLILMDDPLQALITGCLGLDDPFPIAGNGGLTSEQVEVLEEELREDGSLTLLSNHNPDTYGTRFDLTARNLRLLSDVSFPVFVVDSRILLEGSEGAATTPADFIRKVGFDALREALSLSEVASAPEDPNNRPSTFWSGLTRAFKGTGTSSGSERGILPNGAEEIAGRERGESPPFVASLLQTAEVVGQRIAQGFLSALSGSTGSNPIQNPAILGLTPASAQLRLPGGPVSPEAPPSFSVERLEACNLSRSSLKDSGWRSLDSTGVRFRPGELAVIGARSGHGKTSVLTGLLSNWLQQTPDRFVFCSLEESELQVYHRLLSLVTASLGEGVPLKALRDQSTSTPDGPTRDPQTEQVLEEARDLLRGWEDRLQILYCSSWSPAELISYLRQFAGAEDGGLGGILIEPLDALLSSPAQFPPAVQSPGARWLKNLAVELSCPIVTSLTVRDRIIRAGIPCQGDQGTSPDDPRPLLTDFPEEVVRDADLVMGLLSAEAPFGSPSGNQQSSRIPVELGILKDRSGPSGLWVPLTFHRPFSRLLDPS